MFIIIIIIIIIINLHVNATCISLNKLKNTFAGYSFTL